MDFKVYSFRYGLEIAEGKDNIKSDWADLKDTITSITDDDIIEKFQNEHRSSKSLANSINVLIKERLKDKGWNPESAIFHEDAYSKDRRWRLDFARNEIAIEVAFNHREAIAWNMIKPVLSGELNHVTKAIQTSIGVIVTVTDDFKDKGGFDGAVGSYETHLTYLKPLNNILTIPMIIIGLEAPNSFVINHDVYNGRKKGRIERNQV